MNDLISRQAAIDALKNRWKKTRNYEGIGDDIAEECELYLKQVLSAQPTVDAVPVIRCKDCKWYEYDEKWHCRLHYGIRLKDDYCSDAERKEA